MKNIQNSPPGQRHPKLINQVNLFYRPDTIKPLAKHIHHITRCPRMGEKFCQHDKHKKYILDEANKAVITAVMGSFWRDFPQYFRTGQAFSLRV